MRRALVLLAFPALAIVGASAYVTLGRLEVYDYETRARGGLGELKLFVDEFRKREGRAPKLEELPPAGELWRARVARTPHPTTRAIAARSSPTDSGGYGYDASAGKVFIDCTHSDSKLSAWAAY